MLPASMLLEDGCIKQGKQGWAPLWTDPPSPRPPIASEATQIKSDKVRSRFTCSLMYFQFSRRELESIRLFHKVQRF